MYVITSEQKSMWLKELRSGNYTKIKHCMHYQYGEYCALGVLEYCVPNGKTLYDDCCNIYVKDGRYLFNAITELNDNTEMTFPEIADWIEVNLPTKD